MSAVEVRSFSEWAAVAPLAEQWNALAEKTETASVFQTYEWHDAWWKNFGDGYQLLVVGAFNGSTLVGVAPMMTASGTFQRRTRRFLRFIGTINYASDYCNFLLPDDESREGVLAALLDELSRAGRWDIAELARVPTQTPWLNRIREKLADIVGIVHTSIETEAPSRILRDRAEDRAIVDTKSFRRDTGWFEKRAPLRFSHLLSPQDETQILARLDDFFEQHIQRRALVGDSSQFLDPRQKQFYRDLVPALLKRGWLRFAILDWNDVALAYHFGFEYRNRYILYKPTINVEWVKKSPGKVLVKFLIEDAIERKLAEFDFTVGEESYKYRFANVIRTNTRFRAFRSRLDGSAFVILERVKPVLRPIRAGIRSMLSRRSAGAAQPENDD